MVETQLDIESVHKAVCRHYKVSRDKIFQKNRQREFTEMRQVFHYCSKEMTNRSLSAIGGYSRNVTGKIWDHSCVLHSIKTISGLLETNKKIIDDVNRIKDQAIKIQESREVELPILKEDILRIVIHSEATSEILLELDYLIKKYKEKDYEQSNNL